MTAKTIAVSKGTPPRAKWGDANIECKSHELEIRELLSKKWPLKVIWRTLQETRGVSVKYHAFRSAVQKFDKKDIEIHETEEKGTGKLPPVRSDLLPPQRTKKEITPTPSEEHDGEGGVIFKSGVETFKFDTD